MGPAVTQLFLESLRHRDASEEALRRRIEVVRLGVFRVILEVVDRRVLEDWEFFRTQEAAPTAGGESQYHGHGAYRVVTEAVKHSKFRTPETEASQALRGLLQSALAVAAVSGDLLKSPFTLEFFMESIETSCCRTRTPYLS